jgi:hypothetical protein
MKNGNGEVVKGLFVTLSITPTLCHYAECYYADCHIVFIVTLRCVGPLGQREVKTFGNNSNFNLGYFSVFNGLIFLIF